MTPPALSLALPALAWSLVLGILMLSPADALPQPAGPEWLDKPLHALVFAIHCALWIRGLSAIGLRGSTLGAAVLLSACYSLLLEIAQLWVPGRSWEWWDLVAGLAGIALAAAIEANRRGRLRGIPEA